jgi:hypothetical protein
LMRFLISSQTFGRFNALAFCGEVVLLYAVGGAVSLAKVMSWTSRIETEVVTDLLIRRLD